MVVKTGSILVTLSGLFLALILSGCIFSKDKHFELNISKEGNASIVSLYDVILSHPYEMTFFKTPTDHPEWTTEGSKKFYLLHFPIYTQSAESAIAKNGFYDLPPFLYLKTCSSTSNHPILLFRSVPQISDAEPIYDVYFDLKELQKSGYIAKDPIQQEDLCLFIRYNSYQPYGGVNHYTSNVLTYKSEEINRAMAEYELIKEE